MTFSEYISTIAIQDYVEYCKQNNIVPDIELKVAPATKLCALVLPNPKLKDKNVN